jgi:quercetin dioxygenase-like cupin family protein
MRLRSHLSTTPVFIVVVLAALLGQPTAAQYERWDRRGRQQLPWESNRIRVSSVSVDPGGSLPTASGADRVLIYLTADPDGRMPAEAVWQTAGAGNLQNRGSARVQAIAIELKNVPPDAAGGTPPEAISGPYGVEGRILVDNPRVLVTKYRYAPNAFTYPRHLHSSDVLIVYLRGGYAWPVLGDWGAQRVRRGEVDVIPANTWHVLGNAGSDPLEFLAIIPR